MFKEMLVVILCSFTSGLLTQAFISEMISRRDAKRRVTFTPPF